MLSSSFYWPTHKEFQEIEKFGKRARITPKLYSNSMKHFVTRLDDKCWFSKSPTINQLTVAEAIQQYPSYMLWCFKNLKIRWSCTTKKALINLTINHKP